MPAIPEATLGQSNAGRETSAVAKMKTVSVAANATHAGAVKRFEKHFRTLTRAQHPHLPVIFELNQAAS
jgi:hypothetical protein